MRGVIPSRLPTSDRRRLSSGDARPLRDPHRAARLRRPTTRGLPRDARLAPAGRERADSELRLEPRGASSRRKPTGWNRGGASSPTARATAGLFYAVQSLLQISDDGRPTEIACRTIDDAPRFAYRGFMIDVSRHFRSVEFIERQLDAMALFKLNRLHMHLTDGAGWRRSERYPVSRSLRPGAPTRTGRAGGRATAATARRTTPGPRRLLYEGGYPPDRRVCPPAPYRGDPRDRDAGPQRRGYGRLPRAGMYGLGLQRTTTSARATRRPSSSWRMSSRRSWSSSLGVYPHRGR